MSGANGVIVRSRAELERHLREDPIQLRAAWARRGPRVGYPEFIGPFNPDMVEGPGLIRFEADGTAFFVVEKEPWEYERTMALLALLGEDA